MVTQAPNTEAPNTPTATSLIDHPHNRPDTQDILASFEFPDLLDKADRESPTIPFPTMEMMKTFAGLPSEMRNAIWQTIYPSGRDAIMGPYGATYADNHGAVSSILVDRDALVARQVSREALNTWTKASIGKLFMSLRDESLESLEDTIFGVESIVTLMPQTLKLKQLFNSLLRRHERGCKPLKTVYIGISAVVCEADVSPIANDRLGEFKFRVFGLDDPTLPAFLGTCNARRRYHHSKECYITSLQEYWAESRTPKTMRQVWEECVSSNDNLICPELKPVIVATESAEEIQYRAGPGWRSEIKFEKLAYSVQTSGNTEEWFDNWPPHLGHRLLRKARCSKCWPEETGYFEMLGADTPSQEALEDNTG